MQSLLIDSEPAMVAFGVKCARFIRAGQLVFLDGDLGAGKTTIAKGLLSGWGYKGLVTSPTFTLLESYELNVAHIHHFDLYRMESSDELEMIGARELFNASSICLIEWPARADGYLPAPDIHFTIERDTRGRRIKIGGQAGLQIEMSLIL